MNRLYRSKKNRLVAGVCGGLARHLAVDPVILRLALALLFVYRFWLGLVLYGLAVFLIPEGDPSSDDVLEAEVADGSRRLGSSFPLILAVGLIVGGVLLLLHRFLPPLPALTWYLNIVKQSFWPIVLIGLGLWLIFGRNNK